MGESLNSLSREVEREGETEEGERERQKREEGERGRQKREEKKGEGEGSIKSNRMNG